MNKIDNFLKKSKQFIFQVKPKLNILNRYKNYLLVKNYPFLLPRNRWTDEVVKDYDYTYTELDNMPKGWRDAFGLQMCEEIETELEKFGYEKEYRISQIKEKYGKLRWYDFGYPKDSKISSIIQKYEELSFYVCIECGEQSEYVTVDWIAPYCNRCIKKLYGYNHKPLRKNIDYITIDEYFGEY